MKGTFACALLALLACATSVMTMELASYYTSDMVLQRQQVNCIWGLSNVSDTISLNITDAASGKFIFSAKNKTFEDPKTRVIKFTICLPPMNTGVQNLNFEFTEFASKVIVTLKNVLFGDVYFCSGQSNMELPVERTFDFDELKNKSLSPYVRFYESAYEFSPKPIENPGKRSWNAANTNTWYGFSAVCFSFGLAMQKQTQAPIGLVGSYWGGTYIEAWTLNSTVQACVGHVTHVNLTNNQQNNPQWLWNGMVYPYLQLSITGFLWYQGEQNWNNPNGYSCMLINMINLWRESFFPTTHVKPFGIVELSPYYNTDSFVWIRNAQQTAADKEKEAFTVSTVDLGDPTSPNGAIHSRNKSFIGERSALYMLHELGALETGYSGPTLASCCIVPPASLPKKNYEYSRVELTLNFAEGLRMLPTPHCGLYNGHCCNESFIQVRADLKPYMPATEVTIDPKTDHIWVDLEDFVTVQNATTKTYSLKKGDETIDSIAHAWEAYPQCVLWNKWDLPSYPFSAWTCDELCEV